MIIECYICARDYESSEIDFFVHCPKKHIYCKDCINMLERKKKFMENQKMDIYISKICPMCDEKEVEKRNTILKMFMKK
jgi:hypothetical protein